MEMWYAQPGGRLGERTIPLGNGIIGATAFGGVDQEKIVLNHTHLWRHAKTKGRVNPECASFLPKIRQQIFDGDLISAADLAYRTLGTQWNLNVYTNYWGPDPFVPAGQVELIAENRQPAEEYRNSLDLMTGVNTMTYRIGETRYLRRFITPMKDLGFAGRLEAKGPDKLELRIGLTRVEDEECTLSYSGENTLIVMKGEFFEGVSYSAALMVVPVDGQAQRVESDGRPMIAISGATAVELFASVATMHQGEDTDAYVRKEVSQLADMGFERLLERHTETFSSYMKRVKLELTAPERFARPDADRLPTDQRMLNYITGEDDPGLMTLYYQYGRYGTLCSSINGGFPANLCGIWNDALHPGSNADFHHDINSEAPYWMAETANLSETTQALFDYVEWLLPAARKAAKDLYGCGGVYIPLTTGGWQECLKLEASWDEWTGAAAWLAQHFWQHWDFTRDKKFLAERCYPYHKEVAQFYLDYLVPDPRKDHRFYGKLQAVPSYSPENGFREGGDAPVSLSVSCTMDLQLITEVMEHTIAASEILGVDADMRPRWQAVLDNLPPQQIGSQGQLQEWLEEYDEDWDVTFTEGVGHRHCSHLYALFPGEDITATKTPELYEACRKSVEIRVTHHANDKFPWFYAALYARLKMAAQAYENIRFEELRSYPRNTHFRAGQRPVITATINEMLLQSHDGFIDLLPALPAQWASGEVSGLVARGGYECGVRWENGRLTEATITSRLGGQCDVAYLNQRMTLTMKPGETRTVRFA